MEPEGTNPLIFNCRPIDIAKIDKLNTAIHDTNWAQIISSKHISDCYKNFICYFNKLIDECIPLKRVVIPYRSVIREPWMTADLLKQSKRFNICIGGMWENREIATNISSTPNTKFYTIVQSDK